MPGECLRTRYQRHLLSEDSLQGSTLAQIVVGRSCAVGIHIVDVLRLQLCHLKCFCHRSVGSLAVIRRGCLVEGIAGIAVACEPSMDDCPSFSGRCFCLHHDEGSTFTQVQSCALCIEWATGLMIEYHQRVESVQMESCQCL